eukprot:2896168-Alexandrium_andersonii.AAC.1
MCRVGGGRPPCMPKVGTGAHAAGIMRPLRERVARGHVGPQVPLHAGLARDALDKVVGGRL